MQTGLATIIIAGEDYSGHVAFEIREKDGLLFGGEDLLRRAQRAAAVNLVLLSTRIEYRIRVGSVEASRADFVIL